jgi:DNA-directed RNA polymerase subunit RPC12/RpoP
MDRRVRKHGAAVPPVRKRPTKQFERLEARELYCPKCGRAMPVRERLLLVLPEGDKYEYLCAYCGTAVGEKIVKGEPITGLII